MFQYLFIEMSQHCVQKYIYYVMVLSTQELQVPGSVMMMKPNYSRPNYPNKP